VLAPQALSEPRQPTGLNWVPFCSRCGSTWRGSSASISARDALPPPSLGSSESGGTQKRGVEALGATLGEEVGRDGSSRLSMWNPPPQVSPPPLLPTAYANPVCSLMTML